METADFLIALEQEGRSLIVAAEKAGLDAEVPTCPGWRVRDLLRHQGVVHRWAAGIVGERRTARVPMDDTPVPDAQLGRWYRDGHLRLLRALQEAPEDMECWTFLPDPRSARHFWARRQTHETTVHRIDAELAEGQALSPVRCETAADGIDELLTGFHARDRSRVRSTQPRVLRITATDTSSPRSWTVRIGEGPPVAVRNDAGRADCELSGPAEVLFLALWNRVPYEEGLAVEGDASVAELWRSSSGI
ncbi:maleylpyruvate isomerase family mycothiol-dependent enzyme [Streptomyces sp. 549]|uniref:maleylpyruvate isomerase family mycothiol-dependent enzyme n=1 Tax=Streptomyces sp. 549 TaxID=3049076 RepID=UPI0024C2E67E|nr:maleylpyruvate isomerase family mycothiol-dependent enzyme [Streptomyces sp. 549]MDK1474732.1 maleylpyruvate isomerase family mycothiol-dependent enzyme [Streptomyces sp. 549]